MPVLLLYSTNREQISNILEDNIFDTQSCVGRCNDHKEGKGVLLLLGHLMGLCSCMPNCEEMETCCPDFKTVCLNGELVLVV